MASHSSKRQPSRRAHAAAGQAHRRVANPSSATDEHKSPPAPANRPDKHAEIFAAAVRIFEQKGYHGASMQDLADAVGIRKASLYYYIDNKEDLLVEVCERGASAFTRELEEIVASPLPPTEKLRRAVAGHVEALCSQLALFTVFLREQKFLSDQHKRRLRSQGEHHAALLEAILAEGVRCGEFRQLNPKVTTLAILGMSNWLYEWYSPQGALSPRAIASLFSDLILDGVKRTGAAAPARRRSQANKGRAGS